MMDSFNNSTLFLLINFRICENNSWPPYVDCEIQISFFSISICLKPCTEKITKLFNIFLDIYTSLFRGIILTISLCHAQELLLVKLGDALKSSRFLAHLSGETPRFSIILSKVSSDNNLSQLLPSLSLSLPLLSISRRSCRDMYFS